MSAYRFGEYRLDVGRRLLIAGGREIPLSAKIFGVLLHLVRAAGKTVTKDELIAGVWQDAGTSEATVVEHIWFVRKLLDDRARNRKYVLTIPGAGYKFVPPVSYEADPEVAPSAEPAVWREYLLGTYCGVPRSAAGDDAALMHFNAAIALDPSFALGYVGIADCYANMAFQGFAKWERVLVPALAAIRKAIALDPKSALAHIELAQIQLSQWDVLESERSLELAASLDPLSAEVHQLRAFIQVLRGEPESAVADAKCALAIRPTDLNIHGTLANAFAWEGDYANAIASYSGIIEIDPARGSRAPRAMPDLRGDRRTRPRAARSRAAAADAREFEPARLRACFYGRRTQRKTPLERTATACRARERAAVLLGAGVCCIRPHRCSSALDERGNRARRP